MHRSPEALDVPHGDMPAGWTGSTAASTDEEAFPPVSARQMMRRPALLGCYAIMLPAFILLQFAGNAPMLYLFAVVYGFARGGLFTTVSPLVAELFGMRAHGLLYGTVIFAGTIAGAM